jgi:hypothetical protein
MNHFAVEFPAVSQHLFLFGLVEVFLAGIKEKINTCKDVTGNAFAGIYGYCNLVAFLVHRLTMEKISRIIS